LPMLLAPQCVVCALLAASLHWQVRQSAPSVLLGRTPHQQAAPSVSHAHWGRAQMGERQAVHRALLAPLPMLLALWRATCVLQAPSLLEPVL
jgi:hypothetical protein